MMVSLGLLGKKEFLFRARGFAKHRLFSWLAKDLFVRFCRFWLKIDLEEIFRGFLDSGRVEPAFG
jgi:hypothetical protein